MALREFSDGSGKEWMVWEVQPQWIERRRADQPEIVALVGERRHRESEDIRVPIRHPELVHGWLAFETSTERRRLYDFPPNWTELSDRELRQLLDRAVTTTRSRRLIE
jgi:hypothetical protein